MLDGTERSSHPESNPHVYGRDDTKIIVYNMERWLKEGGHKKKITGENNPLNTGNCVHNKIS